MDLGKQLREKIEAKKYREVRKLMTQTANDGKYSIDLLGHRFDEYTLNRLEKEGIQKVGFLSNGRHFIRLSWAEQKS